LLGNLTHLLLDFPFVSLSSIVIFWPLLGLQIPIGETNAFLLSGFSLTTLSTEFLGLIILFLFFYLMKVEKRKYYYLSALVLIYISLYLILYALLVY
ncbi:MAG: hypothetical protein ACFFD1_02115, partial [Candidatus Thorarchaeota archaeon]